MTPILAFLFFYLTRLTVEQKLTDQYYSSIPYSNLPCPYCSFYHTIKNGSTHHGKPKKQCKDCGRQFVINPSQNQISEETKQLIDKLLLERISLRGIVGVTEVS